MTLDLAKLRAETLALIDGTTPGPWVADPSQGEISSKEWAGYPVFCLDQSNYDRASNDIGLNNQQHRDFSLAAAAPTLAADTLRLLDEIERLTAENERLRAVLARIASGKYSGFAIATNPPKDPAVEIARAALAEGGPDDR